MSNKAKPDVAITLDKKRNLRFDLNAMACFEEATGKNLLTGGGFLEGMSASDMRAMLWACLVHEDESLTIKQVGSLITVDNMVEVTHRLGEAFKVAVPSRSEESKEKDPLVEEPSPG